MCQDKTQHTLAPLSDVPQVHEVRNADGSLLASVSRRATGQTHEVTSRFSQAIVTHYIREEIENGRTISVEYVFVGYTQVYRAEIDA